MSARAWEQSWYSVISGSVLIVPKQDSMKALRPLAAPQTHRNVLGDWKGRPATERFEIANSGA